MTRLFISDTHFGGDEDSTEMAVAAFGELKNFLRENNIKIRELVALGDIVERWERRDSLDHVFECEEVIRASRAMIENIFADEDEKKIIFCPGNHDTRVPLEDSDPEDAKKEYEDAAEKLKNFFQKILDEMGGGSVDSFVGIKKISQGVYGHHGDLIDAWISEEELKEMKDEMPEEDKIRLMNGKKKIYAMMQKRWIKYRAMLWPLIKRMPNLFKAFFQPYKLFKKMQTLKNAPKRIMGNLRNNLRNPVTNHVKSQLDLLHKLKNGESGKSVIIAGHTHIEGIVKTKKGTVVSLGAWYDRLGNPTVALLNEKEGKKDLAMLEYDIETKKWKERDRLVI